MTRPCSFRQSDGFTLVDVLAALVIAGLAGSVLVGLVAFMSQMTVRARGMSQEMDSLVALEHLLGSLMEEAPTREGADPAGSPWQGSQSSLSIRVVGPRILGLERPGFFRLQAESSGKPNRLLLQWQDPETGTDHREIVMQDLEMLEFAYLQGSAAGRGTWLSSWSGDRQPAAFRVRLKLEGSSHPAEIVVPLRATLPKACLRDPRRLGCTASAS